MKKKIACMFSILVVLMTGCHIRGVTEPFDQPENPEGISQEKHTLPKEEYVDTPASQDAQNTDEKDAQNKSGFETAKYQLGEAMPALALRGADLNSLEPYIYITITDRHIYDNIKEAGIDESKCNERCEIYPELDEIPLLLHPDQYKEAKVLLLDAHIEVEEWYLNEKFTQDNISLWQLSYVKDNGEYVHLGFPCYFSNPVDIDDHYYTMDLSGKSFDVKIGYIIDESLLKIKKFDLSHLIFNTYGYGPTFKYMELFPEEKQVQYE